MSIPQAKNVSVIFDPAMKHINPVVKDMKLSPSSCLGYRIVQLLQPVVPVLFATRAECC